MTIERLKALAEAYGADLRRWPASERPFAESLATADPAARAVLAEAATLDALLDASPRPAPSAAVAARVLAAAPRAREARAHLGRIFWSLGVGWAAAGATTRLWAAPARTRWTAAAATTAS